MKNIIIRTPKGIRKIGPGQPVFIIAEMSCNHLQSYKRAIKIIDAAAIAGADAIKLQTYTPDTHTIDSDKEYFKIKVNDAWAGQTLYKLYEKTYTPWEWHAKLKKHVESKGMFFFSAPSDIASVDFLEKLDMQLYKVTSFEIVDALLLKKIAQTKKPVIISRGMASIEEIKFAVEVLKDNGAPQIAILHCVSSYPAEPEEMNLATIPDIAKRFDVVPGLSDHTVGITTSIASVVLGACIIEKHFTLSRADGGADAAFSIEPDELKQLVASVRDVEKSIGKPKYDKNKKRSENVVFRRSLFVVGDMKKGEVFTTNNIRSIRPGYGLNPKYFDEIIGKTAKVNIERGTPLSWKLIKK